MYILISDYQTTREIFKTKPDFNCQKVQEHHLKFLQFLPFVDYTSDEEPSVNYMSSAADHHSSSTASDSLSSTTVSETSGMDTSDSDSTSDETESDLHNSSDNEEQEHPIDTSDHDQFVKIVLPTDDRHLFPGSTIPLVVACVLLVTFIYKHNLTKSAWADLLQIICVYCPNIDTVFKSVHTMKKFITGIFDCPEPLEIRYCQKCSKLINNTDKCPGAKCKNAKVNSFLFLHPDKKLKQLFSSQTFLNLLKEGKKNSLVMNENIYDTYDGEDYRTFTTPGGFLHDNYNISFTLNTDGVNKYKSSNAGNIWPVYLVINELPKEY